MEFLCYGSGSLTRGPLLFVDEAPDGAHHMGNRDVDAPFPENLRNPMHAETATMRLQDLFLILRATAQGASFSSSSSSSNPTSVAPSGIAPTYRVGHLKKILGSKFERIRISQGESPRRPDEIENTIL